jgi:hypothetical protein
MGDVMKRIYRRQSHGLPRRMAMRRLDNDHAYFGVSRNQYVSCEVQKSFTSTPHAGLFYRVRLDALKSVSA